MESNIKNVKNETTQEKERVILVAVSDKGYTEVAMESLNELEELAKTAGAVTVEKIVQNRRPSIPVPISERERSKK